MLASYCLSGSGFFVVSGIGGGHQNDDPYYLVASFNLIFSVEVNHHKVCKRLLFPEPF